MTEAEMTKVFAALLLAFPNAEMFKGGIKKLGPTIALWTASLPEVDYWTAEYAVLGICRECKFPPTIAEFKAQAEKVRSTVEREIDNEWNFIRLLINIGKPLETVYANASPKSKAAIERMGGPDKLMVKELHTLGNGTKSEFLAYNYRGFREAYWQIVKSRRALPTAEQNILAIGPKQGGTN